MKDGGSVSFDVNCLDRPVGFDQPSAGIYLVELEDASLEESKKAVLKLPEDGVHYGDVSYGFLDFWSETKGTVSNIYGDIVINVYYITSSLGYSSPDDEPTEEMFAVSTPDTIWQEPTYEPLEEHLYDTRVLNAENGWTYTWDDLPPRDVDGKAYYYKIIEAFDEMGSYEVSYENNSVQLHKSQEEMIRVVNTRVPSVDLKLIKKDAWDGSVSPLAGAEFTLKKLGTDDEEQETCSFIPSEGKQGEYQYGGAGSDKAVTTIVTGANGSWKISGLPKGRYLLEEIKAPDGYNRELRKVTIAVDNDGTVTYQYENEEVMTMTKGGLEFSFDFLNEPAVVLPATGGPGDTHAAIGGLSLMGMSFLMILYESAKRRREVIR